MGNIDLIQTQDYYEKQVKLKEGQYKRGRIKEES
jgi:hypothetical protein